MGTCNVFFFFYLIENVGMDVSDFFFVFRGWECPLYTLGTQYTISRIVFGKKLFYEKV